MTPRRLVVVLALVVTGVASCVRQDIVAVGPSRDAAADATLDGREEPADGSDGADGG